MTQPLPDYFLVKTLEVSSTQPTISTTSRDLKTLQRRLPGHRYDVRMRLDVTPDNFMKAGGWLENMQRDNQFFTYSDPEWQIGSDRVVSGSSAAGGNQVTLSNITGVQVGWFLNFASHAKLYRVVDILANNIVLNTPLQSSVTDLSAVNMSAPVITLELVTDMKRASDITSGLTRELSRINLRAQEAL
jgi:hypothetical protein